ncbi:MAG: 50S ribosomal protein L28 [SAR324 cluster bacterium]|nr:50S ribosomal protein L28 [SAR324 cluster bacterium]
MSYRCMISGKRPLVGNSVSHANNKTKRRQKPNLINKSFYVPEFKRTLKLRICQNILRTIDKNGVDRVLKDHGKKWSDFI